MPTILKRQLSAQIIAGRGTHAPATPPTPDRAARKQTRRRRRGNAGHPRAAQQRQQQHRVTRPEDACRKEVKYGARPRQSAHGVHQTQEGRHRNPYVCLKWQSVTFKPRGTPSMTTEILGAHFGSRETQDKMARAFLREPPHSIAYLFRALMHRREVFCKPSHARDIPPHVCRCNVLFKSLNPLPLRDFLGVL